MSTELSKATLERKDKDELTQIAAAMGGKPTSRARKADIVDMILELAGVTAGPASQRDNADETTDSSSGGETRPDKSDRATRGKGDTRDKGDTSGNGDDGGGGDENDDNGSGDQSQASASYSADPMADARAAESKDTGQGGAGDANQSGDGEPGNRRRRRRGRNRERTDNGEEWTGEPVDVDGFLDLRDDGYGFLRVNGFLPSKDDVYVSVKQVRQFELRKGDHLTGAGRPANRSEKNPALVRIDAVNGRDPEQAVNRADFDDLTAVHPDEALRMARHDEDVDMTGRLIDLVAPIGKGQRGLVLAPPVADKLAVLKQIARSIETNHSDIHLFVLLIDERPEDVTEMQRWLARGEVIASSFDRPSDEHITIAELTLERARRMVEVGEDVVILLDDLTRLTRAYNGAHSGSGRTLPGGLDAGSLYPARRVFGAARNVEEGGSLTIIATARIDTGSALDQAIFEEFAETANLELRLDRVAAERRIGPPVDIASSGTRRADLLLAPDRFEQVRALRDQLASSDDDASTRLLHVVEALRATADDKAFFAAMAKRA